MAALATTLTLVILRIATASWSNVLQKQALSQSQSALVLLASIWGWMTVFSAPMWLTAVVHSFSGGEVGSTLSDSTAGRATSAIDMGASPTASFWIGMFLATVLELPGNWLLLRSLQRTDLSIYGPLNCFKPIVGLLAAMLWLGELPSWLGLQGMLVVLLGSFFLSGSCADRVNKNWIGWFAEPGVRDRMLAMFLTATGSVLLKRAMPGVSPWEVLGVWSLLGWMLASLCLTATRWPPVKRTVMRIDSGGEGKPGMRNPLSSPLVRIAVTMLAMQGLTIVLFSRMPVAYALALFQLGGLASVYLGNRIFGEPDLWRRLTAAAIMVAGAILMLFAS